MTDTVLRDLVSLDKREDGFTLIEILVVIIIIGILAAVAIPIFLNQQRAARDSATISDVRNLATSIETGLVTDPEAQLYELYAEPTGGTPLFGHNNADLDTVYLRVGDSSERIKVTKTKGTRLSVTQYSHSIPGAYVIYGWNEDGLEYTTYENVYADPGTSLVYESAKGGFRQ